MAGELDQLGDDVRAAWQRFSDIIAPLRPALHRYCLQLTRDTFAADDLVQEALTRAFTTLGTRFHTLESPRAWLFRVASNAWIDRVRRERRELWVAPDTGGEASVEPSGRALREAAGTLLVRLSPQERAAVVLKDAFGFGLDEIAAILTTTEGAVKAALHRGRGKLADDSPPPTRAPAPGVLDAFCAAFNARDLDALAALLLDTATVEIVGIATEYGRDEPRDPRTGSLAGTLAPITFDERGGVGDALLAGYVRGSFPRAERVSLRGEPLIVLWYEHDDGPHVRTVIRVATEGQRVAHLTNHFFTPEVIEGVCGALGLPFRVNGYRYW